MKNKFDKFTYQSVESTHKGFQEFLVTFEYYKKPCHYYAFIKEKPKESKKYYLDEVKKEVKKMSLNGELEKRAKRYLNYKLKNEDKLVLRTNNPRVNEKLKGKIAVESQTVTIFRKPSALFVYILICILGAACIGAGVYSVIKGISIGNWPDYILTDEEIYSSTIHLHFGMGLAAFGFLVIVVSTIIHIIRLKHKK